jgi:hypothetical protein
MALEQALIALPRSREVRGHRVVVPPRREPAGGDAQGADARVVARRGTSCELVGGLCVGVHGVSVSVTGTVVRAGVISLLAASATFIESSNYSSCR